MYFLQIDSIVAMSFFHVEILDWAAYEKVSEVKFTNGGDWVWLIRPLLENARIKAKTHKPLE